MRMLVPVLLVLFLVPGWTGLSRLSLPGERVAIAATPVSLDPADPARRRVGRLSFLGGVSLTSSDRAFGGFSAISVTPTASGSRVTLLNDGGNVARFTLGAGNRPRDVSFIPLPAGPGTGWLKEDRDSEALAGDGAGGTGGRHWVAFERANQIWRYAPGFARAERHAAPPLMRGWSRNGGAESLVRRRDGSFVALAERAGVRGGGYKAAVFAGDPTERPDDGFAFTYRPPRHYQPSDAAALPDGRLLVLTRRFRAPYRFSTKLVLLDAAIRPGTRVAGREIATLAAPLIHDNFEALAVTSERGATILWLASDNNETPILQRTLVLKFRLDPGV